MTNETKDTPRATLKDWCDRRNSRYHTAGCGKECWNNWKEV
jgi:hypothetical protein